MAKEWSLTELGEVQTESTPRSWSTFRRSTSEQNVLSFLDQIRDSAPPLTVESASQRTGLSSSRVEKMFQYLEEAGYLIPTDPGYS